MEGPPPLLPLQRSRSSSTPRLCHVCNPPSAPPPLSPNFPRSKSCTKFRTKSTPTSSSSSSSSKENREVGPPHRILSPAPTYPKKPKGPTTNGWGPSSVYPSAWALSPGRGEARAKSGQVGDQKRRGGVLMGYLRKRKDEATAAAAKVEEESAVVHEARMMGCRLMQWRFVNARRERAMARLRSVAERKLFFAWLRIYELRNIVSAKRIVIQRRKHKLKLVRVLNPQINLLNQWEPLAKRHIDALTGLSRVLEATCLPLPLVDGAHVNLVLLHNYFSMSMEIMIEIEAAVRIFYSKVEKLSLVLGELAEIIILEKKGLEELNKTAEIINTLEMQETSLRANLIQASKNYVEPQPSLMSTLRLQFSWMQSQQWHIYNPVFHWNL